MKKKRRLKPKIKVFITFVVAIVLFGYLSFCAINYSISKRKFEQEEKELSEKLTNLKEKEEDLNNEIGKLKDDDYLARYAREEYLYSKDGEYVIKIEEKEKEQEEKKEVEKNYTKYIIYACLSVILVGTIVFVVKLIAFKKKTKKKVKPIIEQ